jgi:hypothetical protein
VFPHTGPNHSLPSLLTTSFPSSRQGVLAAALDFRQRDSGEISVLYVGAPNNDQSIDRSSYLLVWNNRLACVRRINIRTWIGLGRRLAAGSRAITTLGARILRNGYIGGLFPSKSIGESRFNTRETLTYTIQFPTIYLQPGCYSLYWETFT